MPVTYLVYYTKHFLDNKLVSILRHQRFLLLSQYVTLKRETCKYFKNGKKKKMIA